MFLANTTVYRFSVTTYESGSHLVTAALRSNKTPHTAVNGTRRAQLALLTRALHNSRLTSKLRNGFVPTGMVT